MGSVGAGRNSSKVKLTYENAYGFEVENSNSPEVEFTDNFWQKMADLKAYDAFRDSDLSRRVDEKMYDLGENAPDEALEMFSRIQESAVTEDEYWAGYHAIADWLGVKQSRYTVMDSDRIPWDERYTDVEQAEHWAAEHEGAYVYDTWTHKYRKIGGKNWRS